MYVSSTKQIHRAQELRQQNGTICKTEELVTGTSWCTLRCFCFSVFMHSQICFTVALNNAKKKKKHLRKAPDLN